MALKDINALTCSDDFDFVFTDNGDVSVEKTNGASLANMIKLDFVSNDDWVLDKELGLHWVSKKDDGFLQIRGSETSIVGAITRKLNAMEGIREIREITINRGLNRKLYINVIVITHNGEAIEISKEV